MDLAMARGPLMLSLKLMLRLMLLFFMDHMDMLDEVDIMAMLDMLDMDMVVVSLPILMVTLPTMDIDMARGPLMLSLKQRLMLLFFMDHMDMLDVDMLDMLDILETDTLLTPTVTRLGTDMVPILITDKL